MRWCWAAPIATTRGLLRTEQVVAVAADADEVVELEGEAGIDRDRYPVMHLVGGHGAAGPAADLAQVVVASQRLRA
jgi:hypothetical protein